MSRTTTESQPRIVDFLNFLSRKFHNFAKDLTFKSFIKNYAFCIYPILFAVFPLLSFYGSNAAEINAGDFNLNTFLIFNLIVGVIAWAISLLMTFSIRRASILSLVFLAIFFSFGRVHSRAGDFSIELPYIDIGPTKLLILLSTAFVTVAWFWLIKLKPHTVQSVNKTLTLIGIIIVTSTLFTIVPAKTSRAGIAQNNIQMLNSSPSQNNLPDIYYILLDGYGRADYLKDSFGYDNSDFIDFLRSKGFYIAEKSNANYAHTHLSVPSTFNMKYLDYLTEQYGQDSDDQTHLRELTINHTAASILKAEGYKYISIGTQWNWTLSSPMDDIEVEADYAESKVFNIKLDEFALVYFQTTALKPLVTNQIKNNLALSVIGAFERTTKVAKINEPTFSFTHIVSPHPPYLFDENGIIHGQTRLELEGQGFSDRKRYLQQMTYINKLTKDMINNLLTNSPSPPIIIIASDHGPSTGLASTTAKALKESGNQLSTKNADIIKLRMGSLSTFYFPDQDYSKLYPSITPVNTFRVILKQYFDQDLELLPDFSYFSDNKNEQLRMFDVTDLISN